AGVDHLEGYPDPVGEPGAANVGLGAARQLTQAPVGEAETFGPPERVAREVWSAAERLLEGDQLLNLGEEPRADPRQAPDLLAPETLPHRLREVKQAIRVRHPEAVAEGLQIRHRSVEPESCAVLLERAHRLLEGLLERAADGHDLADRLHLGRQG